MFGSEKKSSNAANETFKSTHTFGKQVVVSYVMSFNNDFCIK